MRALALAQIPDTNVTTSVTADKLTLIWVNHHVVDGMGMLVIALDLTRSCIPDSDCHILRACDHPFSLTVKSYPSDIVCMALELHDRIRVGGLDVVQANHMPASCRQVFLVWCDT